MPLVYPFTVATGFFPCSISAKSGPFVPTTGTRYLAMQDYTTGQICIFKSTDEGQTWAIQDNGSAPSYDETISAFGLILAILEGSDIWILVDQAGQSGAPNMEITAYRFDTLTDTWARTDDTGGTFVSDSSTSSGNTQVFGMRINAGEVQLTARMLNDATDGNSHPILMSATIGVPGWAWVYFPQLDGTNGLTLQNMRLATVRGTDMYTIGHFERASFNITYSCFASGGSPAYSDIKDLRAHKIDGSNVISDFLDFCLARAEVGDLSSDGEVIEAIALEVVDGNLWHIYVNQQFPSADWFLQIQGPQVGDPSYGSAYQIALPTGFLPNFFAWISRVGTNPILLFTVDDGTNPATPYISVFDGINWSTPVTADTFFPSIVSGEAMSFQHTENDQSGLLQNDQYWEYKFVGPGLIQPDSIVESENVPTPTLILGTAESSGKSGWYNY